MSMLFIYAITKTCLYNFDPFKPHFYILKLGFTGVYIIFLISAQNIDCGYSLEPPRWGGSNEYTQSMFCAEIWKISECFTWKFSFFGGKISIYLNRRIFVMLKPIFSQRGFIIITHVLTIFSPAVQTRHLANSVDPDETAHNEPSYQDLHCLPFCFVFWLTSPFAIMDLSNCNDGKVHFISSEWKGLMFVWQ